MPEAIQDVQESLVKGEAAPANDADQSKVKAAETKPETSANGAAPKGPMAFPVINAAQIRQALESGGYP